MRAHADKVTPERKFLTMETPFMEAYVQLLIRTCHSRGAFAMGGMAAQIPVKNNPKLAAAALESVKKDKVIRQHISLFHYCGIQHGIVVHHGDRDNSDIWKEIRILFACQTCPIGYQK